MNTQEERDLTRSLQNQADQFHGAGVTFDGVTSRSRSISRRRRMVAGASVLAAAAILVPAATFITGQTPSNPDLPPATDVPSESPSLAPSGEISELRVDAPMGEAPRLSYLQGNTLHHPDGSTLQVPESQYWSFATLGTATYLLSYDEAAQQSQVTELDAAGNVVATTAGVEALAVSPEGSAVAWVGADGAVEVHTEEGVTNPGSVPAGSSAVSILGGSVFFQPPGEGKPGVITSDGEVTRIKDAISISDTSADAWVAAMTSVTDDSSCHRVAPNSGGEGFETCEYNVHHFSPSGQFLSADPTSYGDGMGASGLVLLDRVGQLVAGWEWTGTDPEAQLTVVGHAWEDDEHALAQVYGGGEWTMLRLGADGSAERVLDPIQDEDFNPPWIFAQQ